VSVIAAPLFVNRRLYVDAAERKNFDEDYARASWGAAVLRPYMIAAKFGAWWTRV
jgi:hypothetical protein